MKETHFAFFGGHHEKGSDFPLPSAFSLNRFSPGGPSGRRWMAIALGFVISLATGAAGQIPSNGFFFVQVTDTHLGGGPNHEALAARMVKAINSLPMPIACVVHTGDLAADNLDNGSMAASASNLLHGLHVPCYVLPGNHDLTPRRLETTRRAFETSFGALAGKVEVQGVVFLLLYTEPLRGTVKTPDFDPLSWLETQLKAAVGKPVIVFTHTPPVEDFYNNRLRAGWPAAAQASWTELINRYDVLAVIAGHFHRDELRWDGRVPLYISAPMATYYGRQSSFRIYEVRRDGRLGYRTVYLE